MAIFNSKLLVYQRAHYFKCYVQCPSHSSTQEPSPRESMFSDWKTPRNNVLLMKFPHDELLGGFKHLDYVP